ncbi:flavin reductase (NADPH)-like isoform X3 [Ptychodera flava]|uniref:flavin reductase (NADPH)-like isoform X3 n=1 Tax=Ptychodera flava TaxID=63121 RepID=UPI00396A29DF
MKLTVLGATGGTGRELVRQALERGHHVLAVVRTPSKLTIEHENLKVVQGDVLSPNTDLKGSFEGQDAVLSCLGNSKDSASLSSVMFSRTTIYTDTIGIIVKAMREANVKRLICMTSWCTKYNSKDPGPWIIEWIIKPLILGRVLANMGVMEDFLMEKCSDIDYTVVRPPGLTDKPASGKDFAVEERMFVGGAASQIARADVAKFMLDTLSTDDYNKKAVAIAVK